MRGARFYLAGMTALFIGVGCGKTSDENARKMDPHQSAYPRIQVTVQNLEGVWESDCNVEFVENGYYSKSQLQFKQGILTKKAVTYQDSRCQYNVVWERVYSGQYSVEMDRLRQDYFNLTVTPRSELQTSILNLGPVSSDRYCRSADPFVINEPKSFSPINQCNEETEQYSTIDLHGNGAYAQELWLDNTRFSRVADGATVW